MSRAILFLALVTGCSTVSPSLTCDSDAICVRGMTQGRCFAFSGPPGVCAFPSSTCPSGYVYDSTAGELAGTCVMIPAGTDLAIPDFSAASDAATVDSSVAPDMAQSCKQDSDCKNGGVAPCGGTCTNGTCIFPPGSTDCGSTCSGSMETHRACDGAGSCATATLACGVYQCDGSSKHCRTDCTNASTDCNGTVCTNSQCVACPSDMVYVPAGTFTMGWANPPNYGVSMVTLTKPYCIDKYEVTVAQYRTCVGSGADGGAGSCTVPKGSTTACSYSTSAGANDMLPVNCVAHDQASAFCASLGKRLPTEAEWERAARGSNGNKYPWGGATADCNHAQMRDGNGNAGCGIAPPYLIPVTGDSPLGDSPMGLVNAAGNVAEWVDDCYVQNYTGAGGLCPQSCTDPHAPTTSGCTYSIRGNSALDGNFPPNFTTYGRETIYQTVDLPRAGIRCAK